MIKNRRKPSAVSPEMVVGEWGKHVPGEGLVDEIRKQPAQGGDAEVEREPAGGEEALASFGRADAEDRVRNGKHHSFQ